MSKRKIVAWVSVGAICLTLLLGLLGWKGYTAWKQHQSIGALTPEERCAERFETLMNAYIEQHDLSDCTTEINSTEAAYHYVMHYHINEFDVEITLRSFSPTNEDVFVRVVCDGNKESETIAIGYISQIQEWFTGKSFNYTLLSTKYQKSKENEHNPDYGNTVLDFWGHYTVYYESNLRDADSVMYGFSGKLKS